jgi:hypothetical protein
VGPAGAYMSGSIRRPWAPGSRSKMPGPNGPRFEKPVQFKRVQTALKAGLASLLTALLCGNSAVVIDTVKSHETPQSAHA